MRRHAMAKILFVLSSQADLGAPGTTTGSWLEELATPYYMLRDAGHDVMLTSIKGGEAPVDPMSCAEPWLTPAGQRFLADGDAQQALRNTPALGGVDAAEFDAVFFVGGAGTVWDFPTDAGIARLLGTMSEQHKLVGAVCHGVSALLNGPDAQPFALGHEITVISDQEDTLAGLDKVVPFLCEDRFRKAGVTVKVAEPFTSHVVEHGRLVTGQNPMSSEAVAQRLLDRLAAG